MAWYRDEYKITMHGPFKLFPEEDEISFLVRRKKRGFLGIPYWKDTKWFDTRKEAEEYVSARRGLLVDEI